jgi:hypothetical protein
VILKKFQTIATEGFLISKLLKAQNRRLLTKIKVSPTRLVNCNIQHGVLIISPFPQYFITYKLKKKVMCAIMTVCA